MASIKRFVPIGSKVEEWIDDGSYKTLKQAQEVCEDFETDVIVEIEIKEIRRWKRAGWQQV
jgi:hypothetical protein